MKTIEDLFKALWTDYINLNPEAGRIYRTMIDAGLTVENDHIAFRTFDHPSINVAVLAQAFVDRGYVRKDFYEFKEKKLRAWHYEHPSGSLPKLFISELKTQEFSPELQSAIAHLISQISPDLTRSESFLWSGRPWTVTSDVYQKLLKESEYAAWLSAFGFRANHFTVNLNAMTRFSSILEFNDFIKSHGVKLNTSGGEVKGSPQDFLEQSSTLAGEISVRFTDKEMRIPACYYEFAKRYKMPDGKFFQGFVEKSADKIFESTDTAKC